MSTDLKETFFTACDLFNRRKYDDLRPLMHTDIIMKLVDDPGSVVGIGNVITYLNGHQATKEPKIEGTEHPKLRGEKGTLGQVIGTGRYRDKKGADTFQIQYAFTFTRDNDKSEWMLINSFAVRLDDAHDA